MNHRNAGFGRCAAVLYGLLLSVTLVGIEVRAADQAKASYPKTPSAADVKIMPDAWKTIASAIIKPVEIDQLLDKEQKAEKLKTAPRTSDEQFLRRVTLDLTGKLPSPRELQEFVASRETDKRAKVIDRLLASSDFDKHWARYWHDVVVSRATDQRLKRIGIDKAFEEWLTDQIKANRSWGAITRDILTVKGELKYGPENSDNHDNGAAVFLLCHQGQDAAVERAAETSRVFLGIQIQCAQCHDHPSDIWKREQFHEFTAFFARLRERPIRNGQRIEGIALNSVPFGEHMMPGKDDPKKGTMMNPKFLTGQTAGRGMGDEGRRKALADFITSKDNYWFSAAFVNRTWGEMMGQAFYQPVDNMGPLQEATYPGVLVALAGSFKTSDYDVKSLYRTICNSDAYQRTIRLGDSADQHLHFAGIYPTRLKADQLWESIVAALGPLDQPRRPGPFGGPPPGAAAGAPANRFAARFSPERMFKETFDFDPSTKPDEVEGSIPQALLLMNNTGLNLRMRADGNTVLAAILKGFPQNDEAIKAVYMRVLARKPTGSELDKCRTYVTKASSRNEGFEDIFWALINSTEFQTKR